ISIIACGASYYAGQVGKYLIESIAQIPVEVEIASEFRYRSPVLRKHTLVITVSQSGETADTLAAIRLAKEKGCQTLSICNVKNSTIDREAHGHLYMNSGPEIGVASTKAFVSTLTLFNLVALSIGHVRGTLKEDKEREHVEALMKLPAQMEVVLSYDKYFAEASTSLKEYRGFLYMGRGVNYPIAMEGALKLKELAYLHAEGYAAGEMKHGPLALIDEKMAVVMVVPSDELFEKTVSNLEEAKARGGRIISIGTGDNERLQKISERYLPIPKAHWTTNPILAVVPLQLMAFHLASSMGYDVDQPRNLAKSVTVE
ncbi:MAG: glutamine--fructose-6-phosphate transaminase (isomerizing), partial [Pseudobdellovibrionaceae bacterium]